VGAGQVEGSVRGEVDLREGRSQQPAEAHSAGKQREQAGNELARHSGGAAREGQAGRQDPAPVSPSDVYLRRFLLL